MAEETFYSYDPSIGHGLAHDPFNAIVGPRPIGWISSTDKSGHLNLAPYSFFNAFNYHPPIIGFSSIGWKDTVANIAETGEFVWNLTTRDLVRQMNVTSADVAKGQSEFDLARLGRLPGQKVGVDRVAQSPVHFECRLTQIVQLKEANGQTVESWLVLGEVIAVHIRRDLLRDGIYDTAGAAPVLRAGRRGDYLAVERDAMFELLRPRSGDDVEALLHESP
ncbi:flavin reductase family protein [Gluconacetobacter azotocaptans]|uniref:flavin reductase family protein n=1 Tax=Gluconacetobacter azotocaptans TaxID=142834 RepID=UPI00195DB22F|nr:flavin reductase family protein [Gluconacetobacter azotocaptans]MBM9401134.1 flavin reductase family protein [Gluconacetobacter azotocaptans]